MHPLSGEKLGQCFLPRLLEDRQIAAVDHLGTQCARSADQRPKMNIQLGRAPRQVESADRAGAHHFEHQIDRRPIHLLGAIGTGIDVAVHARLIARVTQVDLQ